jgi:hypothetical protein
VISTGIRQRRAQALEPALLSLVVCAHDFALGCVHRQDSTCTGTAGLGAFLRGTAVYQDLPCLPASFDVSDVRRLRQLEGENARLKKLVAERDLEIDAIKELLRKNV